MPAPSGERQSLRFRFAGSTFAAEPGYDPPFCKTIAEVVDDDRYQLRELAPDELAGTGLLDIGANVGTIGQMKIDCEAGKYSIVEQLTAEIVARVRRITFEVHDRDQSHNVATLSVRLRGSGYRLRGWPDPFGREGLHHLLASR